MLNQQTVLIIAERADFARDIVSRWQTERTVPAFTVIKPVGELWEVPTSAQFDLAVVEVSSSGRSLQALRTVESVGASMVCVADSARAVQAVRADFARALVLRNHEGWRDSLVVLCGEILRRVEATSKGKRAEAAAQANLHLAALGKYMLDARHGFNNALTSVLGNAELMLLDCSSLSPEMREQVDTIHSMALRLHEMMQRFTSLETEMYFAEKQSQLETKVRTQAYVTGSR
jgi:signal transduction histidine kinase